MTMAREGQSPTVDQAFACPVCRGPAAFRDLGREHWGTCDCCRVKWYCGGNLSDAWRDHAEQVWRQNAEDLGRYTLVAREPEPPGPGHGPDPGPSCFPW
jgi:hypothetical protein